MSIEVINNNYTNFGDSVLDFGIDYADQSIHIIDKEIVPKNIIPNPFFVGFKGGSLINQKEKKMYDYDGVVVLLRNDTLPPDFFTNFFNRTIDLNATYKSYLQHISYKKVSITILKKKSNLFRANIVKNNM